MKKNEGVSLIVLVITIIVMIILAGTIVLTLNNSGIMDKASEAVEDSNLATIREVIQVAWADAYIEYGEDQAKLEKAVMDNLETNGITEEDYLGYTVKVTTKGAELVVDHNGEIIPKGAVYYTNGPKEPMKEDGTLLEEGDYEGATLLKAGEKFPEEPQTGDIYVYDNYEYRYNMYTLDNVWCPDETVEGWAVRALGNEKTYNSIIESINKKQIVNTLETFSYQDALVSLPDDYRMIGKHYGGLRPSFRGCSSLELLPEGFEFPENYTTMDEMFGSCSSLKYLPESFVIPSNVTNMNSAFVDCSSLTEMPTLPKGFDGTLWCTFQGCTSLTKLYAKEIEGLHLDSTFVGCTGLVDLSEYTFVNCGLSGTFNECTNLKKAPNINSASVLRAPFTNCTSLTGTINITGEIAEAYSVFDGTTLPIVLVGTEENKSMLQTIASAYSNVTVQE